QPREDRVPPGTDPPVGLHLLRRYRRPRGGRPDPGGARRPPAADDVPPRARLLPAFTGARAVVSARPRDVLAHAVGPAAPRLLPLGDAGLVVQYGGDEISEAANAAVLALGRAVASGPPDGVVEVVPTYRSLLIVYDPLRTTAPQLRRTVAEIASRGDRGPPDRRLPDREPGRVAADRADPAPDLRSIALEPIPAGGGQSRAIHPHLRRRVRTGSGRWGRVPAPRLAASCAAGRVRWAVDHGPGSGPRRPPAVRAPPERRHGFARAARDESADRQRPRRRGAGVDLPGAP